MRLPVNLSLYTSALALIAYGTATFAADKTEQTAAPTGPAADYPVVVGDAFTIGDTVWTPTDQLNYDAVGQAVAGEAGLEGVTAAHKTLPLPSYAEVTSLDTGKTILVRVVRRGPMNNEDLIELSPMASMQLGISAGPRASVRVRRVNPPEQERAMLRSGGRAPERMETPDGLLRVLRRKLAEQSSLAPRSAPPMANPTREPADSIATPKPSAGKGETSPPSPAQPIPPAPPASLPEQPAKTLPDAEKPAAAQKTSIATSEKPEARTSESSNAQALAKGFAVQVAAFTVEANARKAAKELGASVGKAGKFWRVRMGPYANRAQAATALEKAKRSGYSDARIQSAD